MKKFVVVVDTQVDFMCPYGKLYVPESEDIIVPGIEYLSKLDENETVGVLFTFDTHETDIYPFTEEAKQFPPHCLKGTSGWANVYNPDMLSVMIPVYQLEKRIFDMWGEENQIRDWRHNDEYVGEQDEFFNRLFPLVDVVEVWGVASDFCVKDAIIGLCTRGFQINVYQDLCCGIEKKMVEVVKDLNNPNIMLV